MSDPLYFERRIVSVNPLRQQTILSCGHTLPACDPMQVGNLWPCPTCREHAPRCWTCGNYLRLSLVKAGKHHCC